MQTILFLRGYFAFKPGFRYVQLISDAMQVYWVLLYSDVCGIFEVKEGCEEVASVSKSGLPGFMSTVRRAPAARPMCFLLTSLRRAFSSTELIHTNQSEVFFLILKLLDRNISRLSMINLRMSPQHEANMPLSIWININILIICVKQLYTDQLSEISFPDLNPGVFFRLAW